MTRRKDYTHDALLWALYRAMFHWCRRQEAYRYRSGTSLEPSICAVIAIRWARERMGEIDQSEEGWWTAYKIIGATPVRKDVTKLLNYYLARLR